MEDIPHQDFAWSCESCSRRNTALYKYMLRGRQLCGSCFAKLQFSSKVLKPILMMLLFILVFNAVEAKEIHTHPEKEHIFENDTIVQTGINLSINKLQFLDGNTTLMTGNVYMIQDGEIKEFPYETNLSVRIINLSDGNFKFGYSFYATFGKDKDKGKNKSLEDFKTLLELNFTTSITRLDNTSYKFGKFIFNWSDMISSNFTVDLNETSRTTSLIIYKNWSEYRIYKGDLIEIDPYIGEMPPLPPPPQQSGGWWIYDDPAKPSSSGNQTGKVVNIITEQGKSYWAYVLFTIAGIVVLLSGKKR